MGAAQTGRSALATDTTAQNHPRPFPLHRLAGYAPSLAQEASRTVNCLLQRTLSVIFRPLISCARPACAVSVRTRRAAMGGQAHTRAQALRWLSGLSGALGCF